jgi:DNA-binding CsgD family transcriptional regulator
MNDTEYDEIVSGIYSAAAGRTDWRTTLNRLAHAVGTEGVQMIGVSKTNGALVFSHIGGPVSPEGELHYIRTYHRIDPRVPIVATFEVGKWLHCHEHFDAAFVEKDPFHQELLIPYRCRYISATKLRENDSEIVLIGFMRPDRPHNPVEVEVLDHLRVHLVRALELYQELRHMYSELPVGRQLLNRFRYPMLLIDEQRGIRFRNEAAAPMLAAGEYVLDRDGVLACRATQDEYSLTLAVAELALHMQNSGRDKTAVTMRRKSDGRRVAVYVSAIRPQAVMSAFGPSPCALLMFHDPQTHAELDPFIVAETFDLTPAEAKVAVSIAKGKTPEGIAQESRVSIATVRSQVQAIFRKTGVTRQADLVRALATFPDFASVIPKVSA